MKISVLIPTYNEGQVIHPLLTSLIEEIQKISHHSFSVVIIDGNSSDNTQEIVKKLQEVNKNLYLIIEKERGLGKAYLKGINYALSTLNTDAFIEFDGDFQHNPKDISRLIQKLDEGYDYIIGSRYIQDGTIPEEWSWYRKVLSRLGNWIVRHSLSLSITDTTSGFKVTRVDFFRKNISLEKMISLRHAYKIQLIYLMLEKGAKTIEVPIHFLDRKKGFSKSTIEDIFESLKVVIVLFLRSYKQ